jgi:hypothetical protein
MRGQCTYPKPHGRLVRFSLLIFVLGLVVLVVGPVPIFMSNVTCTQIFTIVELTVFYYFSSRSITDMTLLVTIHNLTHYCEIFVSLH